jgi:hypothetical protein
MAIVFHARDGSGAGKHDGGREVTPAQLARLLRNQTIHRLPDDDPNINTSQPANPAAPYVYVIIALRESDPMPAGATPGLYMVAQMLPAQCDVLLSEETRQ